MEATMTRIEREIGAELAAVQVEATEGAAVGADDHFVNAGRCLVQQIIRILAN